MTHYTSILYDFKDSKTKTPPTRIPPKCLRQKMQKPWVKAPPISQVGPNTQTREARILTFTCSSSGRLIPTPARVLIAIHKIESANLPDPKYRWVGWGSGIGPKRAGSHCVLTGNRAHEGGKSQRFGTLSIPSHWANDSAPTRLPSMQGIFGAPFHRCQGLSALDFRPFTTAYLKIQPVDIPCALCASVGHSTRFP